MKTDKDLSDKEVSRIVLAAVRLGDAASFRHKLPPMAHPTTRSKRGSRRRRARYFVRISAGRFEMKDRTAWEALRRQVGILGGIYRIGKHGKR